MDKKKIFAISGSVRDDSTNVQILKMLAEIFQHEIELTLYDGLTQLPYFNPNTEDEASTPHEIVRFRNFIDQADAVVICTPEYVFSLPGILKNALEWTVSTTVFSDKPCGIIVAAAAGEKTFESLDLIMTTIQTIIPNECKLLIKSPRSKMDKNGQVKDETTLHNLKKLMESLLMCIKNNPKVTIQM